jgi:poly(3-hydroxybutyrate) depolymerase
LRGTVRLPSYLDGFFQIAHDPVSGKPVATGSEDVPFVLRLPPPSSAGPAPIVMYQHGNPGSPEEIARDDLNGYLANNGFAVGGIQDYINRRLGDPDAQIQATFFFILSTKAVPAFWNQTGADMIGFLRALQGLGGVAWRPVTAPQTPLLDTTRLFYHGISEGGNNALRFLPFAPELTAATPTVGGGRLAEILLHQYATLLAQIEGFIPGVRPVQTLTGLSLFQAAYDGQDPHSYARFVNRAPLVFPSLPGARAPSILWTEGIGDTFVPNNATRSAARELGIPTMRKVRHASPVLTEVDAPLRANIAADRTSAHFQYDPATTPGCYLGEEGHYCPQTSFAAQQQRLHFFQTALQGPAPELIDPIP